jgi:hypothetical protein
MQNDDSTTRTDIPTPDSATARARLSATPETPGAGVEYVPALPVDPLSIPYRAQGAEKSKRVGRVTLHAPDASLKTRKVSVIFEGLDYLCFSQLMDRYAFDSGTTGKNKKEYAQRIIQVALRCLKNSMDVISAETGSPFVLESDILAMMDAGDPGDPGNAGDIGGDATKKSQDTNTDAQSGGSRDSLSMGDQA